MKRCEHFSGLAILLLVVILSVACTQVKQGDIVGFATNPPTTCTNVDTFSVTTTAGCTLRSTTKELFCPTDVYVQRCMLDGANNVLNYCMNGFCGNSVLTMNFNDDLKQIGDTSGAMNRESCASCPVQILSGRVGRSMNFDGSKWIEMADFGKYVPPQFTILVWVKPSSVIGLDKGVLLTNSEGDNVDGFTLSVNGPDPNNPLVGGPGSLTVSVVNQQISAFAYSDTTKGAIRFNDWNHIAIVFDKGVVTIYHDAIEKTHSASTHAKDVPVDFTTPWRIGRFITSKNDYIGEIDELRVVPRVMSLQEIQREIASAITCGNGFLEDITIGGTEECDDGNTVDFDTCDASCKKECPAKSCGAAEICEIQSGNTGGICVCQDIDVDSYGDVTCGGTDCNDGDATLYQFLNGYVDGDSDGQGSGSELQICSGTALPQTHVTTGGDCDDANPSTHTGATEICDSIDNNCDGNVDEGCPVCGNGMKETSTMAGAVSEQCDDGNTVLGDGCESCMYTNVCGNGILNQVAGSPYYETCDDACTGTNAPPTCDSLPMLESFDGCSNTCQNELCVQQPGNMVAWWDGSSTAIKGPQFTMKGVSNTPGYIGDAFDFTSSSASLFSPTTGVLPTRSSPLTFAAWVKITGVTTQYILSYGQWHPNVGRCAPYYGTSVYLLYAYKNGLLQFTVGTTILTTSYSNAGYPWRFVTATIDAPNKIMKLYLDGNLVGSTAVTYDIYDCYNVVGSDYAGYVPPPGYFIGKIDEVQYYSRALSDAEVRALYNAGQYGICKPKK